MDNQHRQIRGYRELNEEEIAAMNAVKEEGERLQILIDTLKDTINPDPRWTAIATTHLQQGLMALTRAVAKPEFF